MSKYQIHKTLFIGLMALGFCLAPFQSRGQVSSKSITQLPAEILFASIDLYLQKQISTDQLNLRIAELQKNHLWHFDQIKYLKDFYRRVSQQEKIWLFPYCQMVSLFKTDFYLDYTEALDSCSQWPRKHLDLPSFQKNISLLGVKLSATQLQEAEIYEQDYVIREVIDDKTVVSVGPVQEFLARQMAPTNNELAQPLKQYAISPEVEHAFELSQEKTFQQKAKQQSFYKRNKYLTWGLAIAASLVTYQYLQTHSVTIQY